MAARRGAGQTGVLWRQQLLHGFNDIAAQTLPQDLCAHQLFEEQGARTPEAVALVHEGEQPSYAELNGRANQLAHYLPQRCGSGNGGRPLSATRINQIVALLAVLKSGAAYLPVHRPWGSQNNNTFTGETKENN